MAGDARRKDMKDRDYALSRSDFCIFCGGVVPADSADHVPPKGVFTDRKVPEGYVFPACQPCNFGSRPYDKLIAFLSRMDPSEKADEDPKHWAEMNKQFQSLVNERPAQIAQLFQLSGVQKKERAAKMNFRKRPGDLHKDLPFVDIPDWMHQGVDFFIVKLTKALHFHHTGKIVPVGAEIKRRWFTNASYMAGEIPIEVFSIPGGRPVLTRANVDLTDQFNYRYSIAEDGTMAVYSVFFRFAFCYTAIVAFDPARLVVE